MNESNEPKLCVENGKYSDSDNDNDRPKSNLNIIKMQACIALEKILCNGPNGVELAAARGDRRVGIGDRSGPGTLGNRNQRRSRLGFRPCTRTRFINCSQPFQLQLQRRSLSFRRVNRSGRCPSLVPSLCLLHALRVEIQINCHTYTRTRTI